MYIKVKNSTGTDSKFIVIQGLFKDDLLNISNGIKFVKEKVNSHRASLSYDVLTVPTVIHKHIYNQIVTVCLVITATVMIL